MFQHILIHLVHLETGTSVPRTTDKFGANVSDYNIGIYFEPPSTITIPSSLQMQIKHKETRKPS